MNHLIHSRNTPPAAGIADSIAGIAIPFTPATLGNLVNWCEPQNLAFTNPPTNNNIQWDDTIQVGEFYSGTFIQKLTAPIRDITTLNGHNVLTMLSSTVNEYVSWGITPGIENKQVYTFGGILRVDHAAVGYAHAFRCNGLGGCNGFACVRSNAGKLEVFTRTDNNVSITVTSTTTFNGAGWQVVIVQVDLTNGTARLIENGNDLNGAAAQNGVTWNAVNGTANLLNVALFAGYNQWWIGGLGEFFYYSDLKSNADINSLGNYLATKYGLSWVNI